MVRRTKEDAAVTRQDLLRAALAVFSRLGYADTRLEDIAQEAGVTRGAIYHHFGSKQELYNALIEQVTSRVDASFEYSMAQGGPWLEKIRNAFVHGARAAALDPEYVAVMELMLFKTGYAKELDEGMELKLKFWHDSVDVTTEGMRQAQLDGEVRADIDPRDAAISFLALQNGLLTTWLLDRRVFSLHDRAAALIDIFITGIRA
jgi:TetR/AcrR family transcriptional regulator, acrAB operon repressor